MTQTALGQPTGVDAHSSRRHFERLVYAACDCVSSEPAWLIDAVVLFQPLYGLPNPYRVELLSRARAVAAEYKLVATVDAATAAGLTIRFTRPEAGNADATIRLTYVAHAPAAGTPEPSQPEKA